MTNDYKQLEKQFKPCYHKMLVKHPLFGYLVLAVFLIALQLAFIFGDGIVTLTISRAVAMTMIYTVGAMGLGILVGMSGLVSLGTAAFVGLGAYTAGNLLRTFTGIPFTLVLLISILVGVILGAVIGFISLRVRGLYLLVITLAFATIMQQLFITPNDFTGGHMGITGVPFPQLAFFLQLNRETVYFLVLAVMFLLVWITLNIINSPTGRAMLAMYASEPLAQAMGISLLKYRVLAFILATVYAMLAGALLISSMGAAGPLSWTFMLSLNLLAVVILGGSAKPSGVMLGAFFVFALDLTVLRNIPFFVQFPQAIIILTGILMIVIFARFPGGLTRVVLEIRNALLKLYMKWRLYRYGPEPEV